MGIADRSRVRVVPQQPLRSFPHLPGDPGRDSGVEQVSEKCVSVDKCARALIRNCHFLAPISADSRCLCWRCISRHCFLCCLVKCCMCSLGSAPRDCKSIISFSATRLLVQNWHQYSCINCQKTIDSAQQMLSVQYSLHAVLNTVTSSIHIDGTANICRACFLPEARRFRSP